MSGKTRFNHEQLEKMALNYVRSSYPEFSLKNAILETSTGVDDEIRSWWIACEHQDGNESLIEDEQIVLLIQQKMGWTEILSQRATLSEREGFVLELSGK